MKFSTGDKVAFIDEQRTGVVKAIENNEVLFVDEYGFEEWVNASMLIKREKFDVAAESISTKDGELKTSGTTVRKKERGSMEVDLHIHDLKSKGRNRSNHDILNLQLSKARFAIEKARKAHIKKLILIHGLGEGKLRSELHTMLNTLPNLEYFDASFDRYGGGATEIRLYGR